jgi:NAD(P)-dependent dehydrogenase (short-subunit alcohol dehydrogenase family)
MSLAWDVLVNNTGIVMTAEGLTKAGYEVQFGTNHMGHALLMQLLLPTLQETSKVTPKLVVNLSSASGINGPERYIYPFNESKTTMANRNTTARY